MAIPCNIRDREHGKFVDCNNEVAVRSKICQETGETIKVEFDQSGEPINEYNEILSLAGLANADIITYTVPVGKTLKLQRIDFSGDNRAIFKATINGTTEAKKRTWFTSFNDYMVFNNLVLNAGDIVKLIVENRTNTSADFDGNLQGILNDA